MLPQTALVTGAAGFVGSHLVERLARAGVRVTSYQRGATWPSAARYDVVYHLAAESRDPGLMFESNVLLTHRVLSGLEYGKCVVVGSSSELGYKTAPMAESDRPDPQSFYAGTKAAATMLALGFARQFDRDVCVVRPFSLYGPGDRPYRLVPRVVACVRERLTLTLSPASHDWTYVGDFVEALVTIGSAPRAATQGDIVHVGTGTQRTNEELVALAKRLTGVDFPVVADPTPKRFDSHHWVASTSYARSRYRIVASTTLQQGLHETFRKAEVPCRAPSGEKPQHR